MVNYKNGKIYKLVNDELNLTYYGSTCNELRKRLCQHKSISNRCKSKIMFESGEVKIYLVEKFPCNDRIELNQRERFYIENNECINCQIPLRTHKEYKEDNKDKYKEINKKYHKENKEERNNKSHEYYKTNKVKCIELSKKHYQDNKEYYKEYNNQYYEKHKDEINKKKRELRKLKKKII